MHNVLLCSPTDILHLDHDDFSYSRLFHVVYIFSSSEKKMEVKPLHALRLHDIFFVLLCGIFCGIIIILNGGRNSV